MNVFLKGSLTCSFAALMLATGVQPLNNDGEQALPPLPRDPKTITAQEKWDACQTLDNLVSFSNRPVQETGLYLDQVIILNGTLCMAPYL